MTFSFEVTASDPLKHWISRGEGLALKVMGHTMKGREKGAVETTENPPHKNFISGGQKEDGARR